MPCLLIATLCPYRVSLFQCAKSGSYFNPDETSFIECELFEELASAEDEFDTISNRTMRGKKVTLEAWNGNYFADRRYSLSNGFSYDAKKDEIDFNEKDCQNDISVIQHGSNVDVIVNDIKESLFAENCSQFTYEENLNGLFDNIGCWDEKLSTRNKEHIETELRVWLSAHSGTEEEEEQEEEQETAQTEKSDWYIVRGMLGDNCRKAYSDISGLKIGNSQWSIIVPNGYGDGVTRYGIANDNFNSDIVKYFTSVSGEFNIYDYDCGDDVAMTLKGKYGIYYYEGIVLFQKWSD